MSNSYNSETILILFFIGIATLGVMGFPSFMGHMTNPNAIEKFDVPLPITQKSFLFIEGFPITWIEYQYFIDPYEQNESWIDNILQPAFGADQRIVMLGESHNPSHLGTGTTCDLITSPSSATDIGGITITHWRQSSSSGCNSLSYTFDRTTTNHNLLPIYFTENNHLKGIAWLNDAIGNSFFDNPCRAYSVSGEGIDPRTNITAAYEVIDERVDNLSSDLGQCDGGVGTAKVDYVTGTFADYLNSMAINNTFWSYGINPKVDNREGAIDNTLSTVNYFEFKIENPSDLNNTNWMMQEHPKFPSSTLDKGLFGIESSTFTMNTTDTNSDVGQVVIFKEFNKTSLGNNGSWDVKTAISANSFSTATEDSATRDITISPNGTKMYMVGDISDGIHEYTLGTAYDSSSASFIQSETLFGGDPDFGAVVFKPDGTRFYTLTSATDDVIQWNMTNPWDISTTSQNDTLDVSKGAPTGGFGASDLAISPDGLHLYVATFVSPGDQIDQWELTTPWDITTASFLQTFGPEFGPSGNPPNGIHFRPDGLRMFVNSNVDDRVETYILFTAWDISTASFVEEFQPLLGGGLVNGLQFRDDGLKMYWNGVNFIRVYDIDPAGATVYPSISVQGDMQSTTSSADQWIRIEVKDGGYGTGIIQDFPLNGYDAYKLGGSLGVVHLEPSTSLETFDVSFTPNWSNGTDNGLITVFVGIDDNSTSGSTEVNLSSVEWGNTIKYDFEDINNLQFYETNVEKLAGGPLPQFNFVRASANDYDMGILNITNIDPIGNTPITLPTPTASTNGNANATSPTSIDLDWDHDFLNATEYRIQRESPTGGGFSPLVLTNNITNVWTDIGLAGATEYNYEVCPTNGDSLQSTCTTMSATTLSAPAITNLTIVQQFREQAILDWDDFPNAVDYEIYRDNVWYGNVSFGQHALVSGIQSKFIDVNPLLTAHNYSVRADDGSGFSSFANHTFGTINDITGFESNVTGSDVGLSWDAITTNDIDTPITSIHIIRKPALHISEDFENRLVGEEPLDNLKFYYDHGSSAITGNLDCPDYKDGAGQLTNTDPEKGRQYCTDFIVTEDAGHVLSGEQSLVFNSTTRRNGATNPNGITQGFFIGNLTYPLIDKVDVTALITNPGYAGGGETGVAGKTGEGIIYYFTNGSRVHYSQDDAGGAGCDIDTNFYGNVVPPPFDRYLFCADGSLGSAFTHGSSMAFTPFGDGTLSPEYLGEFSIHAHGNNVDGFNATNTFLSFSDSANLANVTHWEYHIGSASNPSQSAFTFPDVRATVGGAFVVDDIIFYENDGTQIPIGNWTEIANLTPTVTSFIDTTGLPSTEYIYKLYANATSSPSSVGEMVIVTNTTASVSVLAPEIITDLTVNIQNFTSIFTNGSPIGQESLDLYPAFMLQTVPTQSTSTLIDSMKIRITDGVIVPGGVAGNIHAVIIGDRTGDLDFDSLLSDIYFIENSTQTVSSIQTYPHTFNFNFTGNTIIDSNDDKVAVGIYITNHTRQLTTDLDSNDGIGITGGTALFLGNICGSLTTFERDGCSDVDLDDMGNFDIFGGNPRGFLNWTAPADNGDAITGYEVLKANATQQIVYDEELELPATCINASDGRCEDIGTVADPLGFVGQRITFPTDVQLTDIMLNLVYFDGTPFGGSIDIQGVILKDAPEGTGSYTRVSNSTFHKLGKVIGGDVTSGQAYIFNTFNNKSPEAFTFNNTILTKNVEYIIGVESFGSFSGNDKFTISHDAIGITGAPNDGLGVFTKLHVGTSDLWVNNSTENLNAMFMGLNYTTEISDTGNTNTEYISTSDFPSGDEKINAYEYLVKAINSGGSANASNTAEISPDRTGFDLWNYREHDTRTFFDAECQFGNNDEGVFTMNNTSGANVGSCDLFKSFDKTEITGSDIGVTINFTGGGRLFLSVIDGAYDKDDFAEFPVNNAFPFPTLGGAIKGIGTLNFTDSFFVVSPQCDGGSPVEQCNIIIPASDINYAGSTEDEISLFLQVRGDTSIGNIEISNVGSWDLTNNPRKVIGIDNGDTLTHSLGANDNQDDRGNLFSNGIFAGNVTVIPLGQVTGLTVIQDMKNEASMDWDDVVNADNYQILVNSSFATSSGSVNANSTWQMREFHAGSSGIIAQCSISVVGSGATGHLRFFSSDGGAAVSNCQLWKQFPRDMLNNTKIQVKYEYTSSSTPLNSASMGAYSVNEPDQYLPASDESQYPDSGASGSGFGRTVNNGYTLLDSEGLNINGGVLVEDVLDFSADWNEPDSDYAEILFVLSDGTILSTGPAIKIFWINMTDFDTGFQKAFYNFSGSSVAFTNPSGSCDDSGNPVPHKLQCATGTADAGTVTVNSGGFSEIGTSSISEFNYTGISLTTPETYIVRANNSIGFGANSTEVEFGLIQSIKNLIATGLSSSEISLNWTLANTVHPTDALTGVIIQDRDAIPVWYDGFTATDFADSTESMRPAGTESMMGYMQEVHVDEPFEINTMTIRLKEGTLTTSELPSTFSAFVVTDPEDLDTPSTFNSKLLVNSTNNFDSNLLTDEYQEFQFTFPPNTIPKGFHGFGIEFNPFHDTQVLPEMQDSPDWITVTKGLPSGNSTAFSIGVTGCNTDAWKFNGCGANTRDFVGIEIVGTGYTNNFAGETPVFSTRDFGNWTTLTTVDDLDTSYVDNGLSSDDSKSYRLKGSSAVSTGAFLIQGIPSGGGVASNTTLSAPAQVTGLTIIQNMSNNADLDWSDVVDADNYQVFREINFTQGENANANSTWQFREQHTQASDTDDVTGDLVAFTDFVQMSCEKGECYTWKTFPRDLINNTVIDLHYESIHTTTSGLLTFKSFVIAVNATNEVERNNEDQWTPKLKNTEFLATPNFSIRTENLAFNTEETEKISSTFGWTVGTSDYVTIMLQITDDNVPVIQNPRLNLHWLNFTDIDTGAHVMLINFSNSIITNEIDGSPPSIPDECQDANECLRATFIGNTTVFITDFEVIGAPTLSEFEDSTLSISSPSTYKVRANNTIGFGDNSTDFEFGLIQEIKTLNATALNETSILLEWDVVETIHPTDVLTGVIIQRNGSTIATVDELDTSFTDNAPLTAETNYGYRLKGQSAISTGAFDNEVVEKTLLGLLPPAKPIDVNATAVQRDVLIRWTQPIGDGIISDNATDFEIKRNGTTIVSSVDLLPQGVFSDDFSTYPTNSSADLSWVPSGVDALATVGVNTTNDEIVLITKAGSSRLITFDLEAELGFNVTDASGVGDFVLRWEQQLREVDAGAGLSFVQVGLSDSIAPANVVQNGIIGLHDFAPVGGAGSSAIIRIGDDATLQGNDFLDLTCGLDGVETWNDPDGDLIANLPIPTIFGELNKTGNDVSLRYGLNDQYGGLSQTCSVSGTTGKTIENLKYITIHRLGAGGSTAKEYHFFDNIELFINGTLVTSWLDINPGLNTPFEYSIIPSNLAGDGTESDLGIVTTNDLPSIPTSESAMALSGTEIEVTWTAPSDYGAGSPTTGITPEEITIFKENTTDTAGFFLLDIVPASPASYSDTIVDAGKNYTYKLAGTNSIGNSGNTTEVLAFTVDNTIIFTVLENDLTTTLENLAFVTIDNGVDSETKLTNPAGKVQFNEKVGNYDIIVKETENDFVILKVDQTFVGTGTELFNLQTLVFRTNCAVNDPPLDPDVRILVNHTDAHLVTAHSTPVCIENPATNNHEITWTETFTSDSASGSIFTSKMIADVLRADTFGTGTEVFEIGAVDTGISYNSGEKKLSSVTFDIGTGLSSPSFAFFLELDVAQQSGGGDIGGPTPNPKTDPPSQGGGGTQTTSSPAPFGEFQLATLSITSDKIFLTAGERFESDLFIDWNVDDNFIITGVTVDKNPRWFAFESTPKPFNSQGAFGTADLAFTIQLDPVYCNPVTGVTVNCVERGEITIPVTVSGIVGGKQVEEQHFITIDTSERFGLSTFLIIFLVFFLIIALAVASNRASKQNKKKVQQKVKRRVPQKNKKKGSTVQRLKSRR